MFTPLNDRILVLADSGEKVSAGGIVLPGTAKEKFMQGKVQAVGAGAILPDGTHRPLTIKVGDVVMFGRYSGIELEIDGTGCLVLREEEVLGVIS